MKHEVLGVGVDTVTEAQAVERIKGFVQEGGPHQVVTANPEILDNATRNVELRELINKAALVTADGQGVLLAGRILGKTFPERVTGIELAETLCRDKECSLYFLGAAPGIADEAKERMERLYPGVKIVGAHHGYFKNEGPAAVVAEVKAASPDILLVGMGSPYQETFIRDYLGEMGVPVGIGVGGSFDVLSGRVARAPEFFQKAKLEWLYRIAGDRKRWKRSIALPRFVLKVIAQRFGLKK